MRSRFSTCTAVPECRVSTPVRVCCCLGRSTSTSSTATPWPCPGRSGTSTRCHPSRFTPLYPSLTWRGTRDRHFLSLNKGWHHSRGRCSGNFCCWDDVMLPMEHALWKSAKLFSYLLFCGTCSARSFEMLLENNQKREKGADVSQTLWCVPRVVLVFLPPPKLPHCPVPAQSWNHTPISWWFIQDTLFC